MKLPGQYLESQNADRSSCKDDCLSRLYRGSWLDLVGDYSRDNLNYLVEYCHLRCEGKEAKIVLIGCSYPATEDAN